MKAMLLAAGEGTRLRPLTLEVPKCLVPISGKPLIEYWFDTFEQYGITEVLINTSYLARNVRDYLQRNSRGIKIRITYEEYLLGSGGTVKSNWNFVKREELFFIFYADNLTNINLDNMLSFHHEKKKQHTLALFKVPTPRECGIVEIDENSSVVSFAEKPENPDSDLAFAGIILSTPDLSRFFPDKEIFDLGYDVLPRMVGSASGYLIEEYLLDIGTPEKLEQAERDMKNNAFRDRA